MGSSIISSTSMGAPLAGRPELAAVIVNYRSWGDVAALVDRLADSPAVAAGRAEVVVVDNASGEPVPGSLRAARHGVRLLLRGTNDGFSAGVNAGWRATRARRLLVLNPDIVAGPDFLDRVLDRAARLGDRVGVVGFGLRNADGTRQPSVGAFPGLFRTVWEQVLPRGRRKYQPDRRHVAGPVDWVTGACFLVAAALLEETGGMDEDFFLYHEEVALCRVATRRGWTVEFDPDLAVVHLRPLQDRAISPKMRLITRHSKLLYFRKHLPRRQFVALAWAIQAEGAARAAWARLRGRAGGRTWRAIGRMARGLRLGADLKGPAVLALAEAATAAADDPAEGEPRARPSPMNDGRAATAEQNERGPHGRRPASPATR